MTKFVCSSTKNSETFSQVVEGLNLVDAEAYFRNRNAIKSGTPVYTEPLKMGRI